MSRWVWVGHLMVAVLALSPSGMAAATATGDPIVPADRELLRRLFYVGLGDDRPVALQPGVRPPVDASGNFLEEDDPLYLYRMRGIELARAHQALMQAASSDYRRRFEDLERHVILNVLPGKPNAGAGQEEVYRQLVDTGLAVALLELAGSPVLITPPPGFDAGDDGSGPFIVGGSFKLSGVRESAAPFHCCGGQLVVTDLGEPYRRYSDAHWSLYRDDSRYRAEFDAATEPFSRKTTAYGSPLTADEHRDCEDVLTSSWRRALAESGVLEQIEKAAHPDEGF